jgi:hypothetical protein
MLLGVHIMHLETAPLLTGEVLHADGERNVTFWPLGENKPSGVF